MIDTPITMTYSTALENYRYLVNRKLPGGETKATHHNINETNKVLGREVRGGLGRGQGRGGCGGQNKQNRMNEWFITCTDGSIL